MSDKKKRIAVLISGGGTNLQALIDACADINFPAEIVLVVSNQKDAYGLQRAEKANIPAETLPHKDFANRASFDAALHQLLIKADVELVCLAGFMRLLTADFINQWHNKMINIHPSLLPAFPGLNVQARAIEAGVRFSGCTVHVVRAEMDTGPIIIQAVVPILPDDTADKLQQRILKCEHQIYPKALDWFARGKVRIENERAIINGVRHAPSAVIWPDV